MNEVKITCNHKEFVNQGKPKTCARLAAYQIKRENAEGMEGIKKVCEKHGDELLSDEVPVSWVKVGTVND